MKAKGIFISALLVVDTFLVSYAAGFHSRHVLVVNPKLPPVLEKKVEAKPAPVAVPAKTTDTKDGHGKHTGKDSRAAKTHGKNSHNSKAIEKSADSKGSARPADTKSGAKQAAKTDLNAAAKPVTKTETKPATKPAAKPAAKSQAKPRDKSVRKEVRSNPGNPGA